MIDQWMRRVAQHGGPRTNANHRNADLVEGFFLDQRRHVAGADQPKESHRLVGRAAGFLD